MEFTQKFKSMSEQLNNTSTTTNSTNTQQNTNKQNQVGTVILYGIPIVSLIIESQERLCLAQISNTLLKQFSYNEIHNRRVALGITCVQCTPVQLEILRRAGAMPVSSRRCGMITRREAERLCKSFLGDNAPPRLPEDFAFSVHHECAWGCRGSFLPSRYNSSRAKCIKCIVCGLFFSPNKFIFHSHRMSPSDKYVQPDAANFNSWRRHMKLSGNPSDEIIHAWEDVKAMFNGGTRKRLLQTSITPKSNKHTKVESEITQSVPVPIIPAPRLPNFSEIPLPISRVAMDFMYNKPFALSPYSTLPWLKRNPIIFSQQNQFFSIDKNYQSAFKPVYPLNVSDSGQKKDLSDDEVDIETTDDKDDRSWSEKSESMPVQLVVPLNSNTINESNTVLITPKPEHPPTERVWNLSRIPFDCTDRNNFIYKHDVHRHFVISAEEPSVSNSPIPLMVKPVLECTVCQNHSSSNLFTNLENNNKMIP